LLCRLFTESLVAREAKNRAAVDRQAKVNPSANLRGNRIKDRAAQIRGTINLRAENGLNAHMAESPPPDSAATSARSRDPPARQPDMPPAKTRRRKLRVLRVQPRVLPPPIAMRRKHRVLKVLPRALPPLIETRLKCPVHKVLPRVLPPPIETRLRCPVRKAQPLVLPPLIETRPQCPAPAARQPDMRP
jgi:hypothetical protein